jgi:hypothetical protein
MSPCSHPTNLVAVIISFPYGIPPSGYAVLRGNMSTILLKERTDRSPARP